MKKPKYKYEIGIQVNEIWVYVVDADSMKEAVNKIREGDESAGQVCSVSGGYNSRRAKLYKKEKN